MKYLRAWVRAIDPAAVLMTAVPAMLGAALAYGDGILHRKPAVITLAFFLLLQMGVNCARALYDRDEVFADGDRPSGAAMGGISALCFIAAAFAAHAIYLRIGMPALAVAIAVMLMGILYALSRTSIAGSVLGGSLAFFCYGPLALAGTYYAITFEYNAAVITTGCMSGSWALAIWLVRAIRDIGPDPLRRKFLTCVRLGFVMSVLLSALVPVAVYAIMDQRRGVLLASLLVFLAVPLIHLVYARDDRASYDLIQTLGVVMLALQAALLGGAWIQ